MDSRWIAMWIYGDLWRFIYDMGVVDLTDFGVCIVMGDPQMDGFSWKFLFKWMMTGGTPISGNH